MDKNDIFRDFNFWRHLVNVWSLLFFLVIIYDFTTNNTCTEVLNIMSTIYIGALAIYVSNKEFERWYHRHNSQHPGEVFIVVWTILIFSLIIFDFISVDTYSLPASVISSYIAVLTILAVTRKSKQMYQAKHAKR
jgi:hypothetical protein